jgi:hypothetical protein
MDKMALDVLRLQIMEEDGIFGEYERWGSRRMIWKRRKCVERRVIFAQLF